MAEKHKLQRLVESLSVDSKLIYQATDNELKESLNNPHLKTLKESIEQDSKKGWWVPISWYDKVNANKRNYPKALWENVKDNQKATWQGSPMLMDHPKDDSDGSPKDICGVWLDMKLDAPSDGKSGLVYGLVMPSGSNGKELQDHLQNGLRAGTSSVGFGDVGMDGVTVDPDSFQIERLSDWVLVPSQGTYFTYEPEDDNSSKTVEYATTKKSPLQSSTFNSNQSAVQESMAANHNILQTNNRETTLMENTMQGSKVTRMEEKRFRREIQLFLEDAAKLDNPQQRLKEFEDILSYFDEGACPDLRESVQKKIDAEKQLISEAVNQQQKMNKELDVNNVDDLKEKLTKIADDTVTLKESVNDWHAAANFLQNELATTTRKLKTSQRVNYGLKLYGERMNVIVKHLNEKAAEGHSAAYVQYLREKQQKMVADYQTALKESRDDASRISARLNKLTEAFNTNYKKLYEAVDVIKQQDKVSKEQASLLAEKQKNIDNLRSRLNESTNNVRLMKDRLRKVNERAKIVGMTRIQEAAKAKAQQPIVNGNAEVTNYYNQLHATYGNELDAFESNIRMCPTLSEAKSVFVKNILPSLKESQALETARLPEGFSIEKAQKASDVTDSLPQGWK